MVSLSQNCFFGQLPQNLSKLSPLEHLDLRDTNLTSEFPAFLSQLSSLQVLNIRNTALEGSITDDLLNLGSLHILDLSNNDLTGKIPSSFGNLAGMTDTPSTLSTLPEIFTIPVEIQDLIVIWKNSKQKLYSKSLAIYSLPDLSNNQFFG